jgi:hypothetical protein
LLEKQLAPHLGKRFSLAANSGIVKFNRVGHVGASTYHAPRLIPATTPAASSMPAAQLPASQLRNCVLTIANLVIDNFQRLQRFSRAARNASYTELSRAAHPS